MSEDKREPKRHHVTKATGNNEWYTPSHYILAAYEVVDVIDLDPASTKNANRVVQATEYYTAEQDGLSQPWHGRVWLNPPYARPLISRFCRKLIWNYQHDNVSEGFLLVNNATDTAWFQEVMRAASAACFHSGRIRFWSPKGFIVTGDPLQGSVIFYLGPHVDKFVEAFEKYGITMRVQPSKPEKDSE